MQAFTIGAPSIVATDEIRRQVDRIARMCAEIGWRLRRRRRNESCGQDKPSSGRRNKVPRWLHVVLPPVSPETRRVR